MSVVTPQQTTFPVQMQAAASSYPDGASNSSCIDTPVCDQSLANRQEKPANGSALKRLKTCLLGPIEAFGNWVHKILPHKPLTCEQAPQGTRQPTPQIAAEDQAALTAIDAQSWSGKKTKMIDGKIRSFQRVLTTLTALESATQNPELRRLANALLDTNIAGKIARSGEVIGVSRVLQADQENMNQSLDKWFSAALKAVDETNTPPAK